MDDLFGSTPQSPDIAAGESVKSTTETVPLAARLRPKTLEELVGQAHLLGPGKPLRKALDTGRLHSMVLWGPPGVGKTTFARILANHCQREFMTLSAVTAGIKDIRIAVDRSRKIRGQYDRGSLLFIDEVHRFNKAQQDALLPVIEDGTFLFVGATTENPAFELNNALLSRAKVYVLESLGQSELELILVRALKHTPQLTLSGAQRKALIRFADGDARRMLNAFEMAADLAESGQAFPDEQFVQILSGGTRRFDKGGDYYYDQISALHKSIRGSDPDASLYWFARMLDGGCDPKYLARRLVRIASEDIGNADPRSLALTTGAAQAYDRLGSPEGELALAQAVVYLAVAPKSNAIYKAFKAVMADVKSESSHEVPMHLRNAPTSLAQQMGHGAEYRYAHDEPEQFAAGETYFPNDMPPRKYYEPRKNGLEMKIRERLDRLAHLNEQEGARQRQQTEGSPGHTPSDQGQSKGGDTPSVD